MRGFAVIVSAVLALSCSAFGSPVVSPEEAEVLRLQAVADRGDRLHGQVDYILEHEDAYVDAATGTSRGYGGDCSQVPVSMRRTDGVVIVRRMDFCE